MSALGVLIDGAPLPDDEARAFWKRFSDWMEEHRGDLAGFARAEGFASVHPEMHVSGPVLIASRTAPQRPYSVAAKRTSGGVPAKGVPGRVRPPKAGAAETRGTRTRRPAPGGRRKGRSRES
jgi:hypothetical protein